MNHQNWQWFYSSLTFYEKPQKEEKKNIMLNMNENLNSHVDQKKWTVPHGLIKDQRGQNKVEAWAS